MSNELSIVNNTPTSIQTGGLGVNFDNPLFRLKPATLGIVQPNSQVEGGLKGHLRISETGDQFPEMWATLLVMPTEQRQYYLGNQGEMNRSPENLACFSTDMIKPSPRAKIPQAMQCQGCSKADWTPWREYNEKNNGQSNKALIPPCESNYVALLIDTKYKLPLRMYIRSKAKDSFEAGMHNLARVLAIMKAEGKNPNIFDVKFKVSTKTVQTGKFVSYVPVFSDFTPITPEEREQFGAIYLQYINKPVAQAVEETDQSDQPAESEPEVIEGQYESQDEEITI